MNYEEILDALETGNMRAASPSEDGWVVNLEVKQAILQSFKEGVNIPHMKGFTRALLTSITYLPGILGQRIRFDLYRVVLRCVEGLIWHPL